MPRNVEIEEGITSVSVSGFKSIHKETAIAIRPLTLLAGPNSSGKSSIIQPLLLLKQTLEASYDPGPLKLNGPNVHFTGTEQFLYKSSKWKYEDLQIQVSVGHNQSITVTFRKAPQKRELRVVECIYDNPEKRTVLKPDMAQRTIIQQLPSDVKKIRDRLSSLVKENFLDSNLRWRIHRSRFLLDLELYEKRPIHQGDDSNFTVVFGSSMINLSNVFEREIQEIIHVPGLRGNPSRQYVATPVVGPKFEGTFENYVAAVINYWQEVGDLRLQTLSQNLLDLGLTSVIRAKRLNDTQVELRVGRRLQSTENDLVSIADVGFGVSQVLPVLVALLVAKPQQFVYIEQPEIHLHPKAQHSLASMIADAANRGVRVIVETHSDLLLLGIQTLVAQRPQYLKNKDVILHWFSRHDASTQVTSRELDKEGAYGDWPEDFADVRLEAQRQYLDAADEAEMER